MRLLDGELITEEEAQKDLTNHQRVLMMNREQLAKFLYHFDANLTVSQINIWLGEKADD